jgi:hypothetical protein
MPTFKILRYTDNGDIMLSRTKENEHAGGGLPPTTSQVIMMDENEIIELIKVLTQHANERRNP